MATNITQWIPKVVGSAPGAPKATYKEAIISALREFCKETRLWTEELTAISIVADTAEYALTSTSGDIVDVNHVEIDDVPIDETSEEYLDQNEYMWRSQTSASPLRFYVNQDREIGLVYTPSVANTDALAVWVNLMPSEDATTVEDWLWEDHWRVISHGAKAELLEMTAMPWGNIQMAEYFRQKFEDGIDAARIIKETGYSAMQPSVRFVAG